MLYVGKEAAESRADLYISLSLTHTLTHPLAQNTDRRSRLLRKEGNQAEARVRDQGGQQGEGVREEKGREGREEENHQVSKALIDIDIDTDTDTAPLNKLKLTQPFHPNTHKQQPRRRAKLPAPPPPRRRLRPHPPQTRQALPPHLRAPQSPPNKKVPEQKNRRSRTQRRRPTILPEHAFRERT